MKTTNLSILTLSLALTLPSALLANQATKEKPAEARSAEKSASSGALSAHDETFLKDAARGGMAEVRLGQLAQEKGNSPQIKEFGSHMVRDHSQANDALKSLAANKKVTLPSDLDPKHQAAIDQLSKLSGAEFDRAFADQMVRDHKKDVSEFESASKSAKDPEVKAFAERTLPTLQGHLTQAEGLARSEKGPKAQQPKSEQPKAKAS